MRIELKCRSCNCTFQIPFQAYGLMLEKCPHCQCKIERTDNDKLYNMTEKADYFLQQLDSVKLLRIIDDGYAADDSHNITRSVFQMDIDEMKKAYETAPPKVKEKLDMIIDKLYLLTYHDTVDGNLDNLNHLYSLLDQEFCRKVESRNKVIAHLLSDDDD